MELQMHLLCGCDVCRSKSPTGMKRCSICKNAYYCSVTCQKADWKTHKPNCVAGKSAVKNLIRACCADFFPDHPAASEFGFDNLLKYYRHYRIYYNTYGPLKAGHVLLGMLQNIGGTIGINETELEKAYLTNTLDDYLQSKIAMFAHQSNFPRSHFWKWRKHKLIIGPTRVEHLSEAQVIAMRNKVYRKYYT